MRALRYIIALNTKPISKEIEQISRSEKSNKSFTDREIDSNNLGLKYVNQVFSWSISV